MDLFDDLLSLARQREIEVFETPLTVILNNGKRLSIYGYYQASTKGDFILINEDIDQDKKAFTLAHELAHYAIHRDTQDIKRYEEDMTYFKQKEEEANAFAERLISYMGTMKRGNYGKGN